MKPAHPSVDPSSEQPGAHAVRRFRFSAVLFAALVLMGCGSADDGPDTESAPRFEIAVTPTGSQMSAADAEAMDKMARTALAGDADKAPGMILGIWDPEKGYHIGAYGKGQIGED